MHHNAIESSAMAPEVSESSWGLMPQAHATPTKHLTLIIALTISPHPRRTAIIGVKSKGLLFSGVFAKDACTLPVEAYALIKLEVFAIKEHGPPDDLGLIHKRERIQGDQIV